MKILLLNLEFDCGGASWNLMEAIRTCHPGHEVRHAIFKTTYAAPNSDILFKRVEDLLPFCEWADVIHFNNWLWTHKPGNNRLGFYPVNEYGGPSPFESVLQDKSKTIVYHFHGGNHQLNPKYWLDECTRIGVRILKCDPLCPIPGATWLPNVLDLKPAQVCRHQPFGVAIMGNVSDQRRNNYAIQSVLKYLDIPHKFFGEVPRQIALVERRKYPVCIDNLTQGFAGMWTWEALAMGQVPIARLDPAVTVQYQGAPIVQCPNLDWVSFRLRRFQDDPVFWDQWSRAGVAWTEEHNSSAAVAGRYIEFYQKAKDDPDNLNH